MKRKKKIYKAAHPFVFPFHFFWSRNSLSKITNLKKVTNLKNTNQKTQIKTKMEGLRSKIQLAKHYVSKYQTMHKYSSLKSRFEKMLHEHIYHFQYTWYIYYPSELIFKQVERIYPCPLEQYKKMIVKYLIEDTQELIDMRHEVALLHGFEIYSPKKPLEGQLDAITLHAQEYERKYQFLRDLYDKLISGEIFGNKPEDIVVEMEEDQYDLPSYEEEDTLDVNKKDQPTPQAKQFANWLINSRY